MKKIISVLFVLIMFGILFISCDKSEVEDIDGRVYKTVKIGNQIWMAENLSVTKFRNGDPIFRANKSNDLWTKPSFVLRPIVDDELYGKIYNWEAVNDPRGLAPDGWRIPNEQDWDELFDFLGGKNVAGAYLKSKNGWDKNGNGLDKYGFKAMPGGDLIASGGIGYGGVTQNGYWWSSPDQYIAMIYYSDEVFIGDAEMDYYPAGYSVRCIKNSAAEPEYIFDNAEYLIREKQVGNFKIGNPIPSQNDLSNYQIRKEKNTVVGEAEIAYEEITYVISENGSDQLIIKPGWDYDRQSYDKQIAEIFVISDKFKTKDGIEVGDPISKFQTIYPKFSLWGTYDQFFINLNSDSNIRFELNLNDFIGDKTKLYDEQIKLKTTDFKSEAKIKEIRIH